MACIFFSYDIITCCAAQRVYLEFLERTNNSVTMQRCDDCGSDAIDLSENPVPFGDNYHYIVHVRTFIAHKKNEQCLILYRLQPMDSYHLDNIFQFMLLCSQMKPTFPCLVPLWLHRTGEMLITAT